MRRYYPKASSIWLQPMVAAMVFGAPFSGGPVGLMRAAVVFSLAFLCWRHFLSVQVTAQTIQGRHPSGFRKGMVRISAVVEIRDEKLSLGGISGWTCRDADDNAVFLHRET